MKVGYVWNLRYTSNLEQTTSLIFKIKRFFFILFDQPEIFNTVEKLKEGEYCGLVIELKY